MTYTTGSALALVLPFKKGIFLSSSRGLNRVWWHYTHESQERKLIERAITPSAMGSTQNWIRLFQRTVLLALGLRNIGDAAGFDLSNGSAPITQAHDLVHAEFNANCIKLGLSEMIVWDIIDGDTRIRAQYGLDNLVIEA